MYKKTYSAKERLLALKLADEIKNRAASERLGIKLDTLYSWISKAKNGKT
ncbi:helix-turn-helix domain-containing protein [Acetobacterium fimetarium]